YLSVPLMRQLTDEQVLAVIGHELGHFKGEDTQMSRQFAPLYFKTSMTYHLLSSAGLIAWPARTIIDIFHELMEPVIASQRRLRELEADSCGAFVTSAETVAHSLIRSHYLGRVFGAEEELTVRYRMPREEASLKVRAELEASSDFWQELSAVHTSHPFDSHPPLLDRLKSLGFASLDIRAAALLEPSDSAYDLWLGAERRLDAAESQYSEMISSMQEIVELKTADAATAEGRALLEQTFPEVRFPVSRKRLIVWTSSIAALCGFTSLVPLLISTGLKSQSLTGMFLLLTCWFTYSTWAKWSREELVIRYDRFFVKQWSRPAEFSEIDRIHSNSVNGSLMLTIVFTDKQPPLWRRPLLTFKRRNHSLGLGLFGASQDQIVDTLFRYFQRDRPEASSTNSQPGSRSQ
ncbi:MAG TPA: M48 family metalloprotease, partial [Bdellovibrionales bacterium]|nr:M48 family metalloprotease [Bdellovibrionales bacterium]